MDQAGTGEFAGFGSLTVLSLGDSARVTGLVADGLIRRRLLDLGFVPGTVVKAAFRSPFGEPVAYAVRGTVIALRTEDADRVLIGPDK